MQKRLIPLRNAGTMAGATSPTTLTSCGRTGCSTHGQVRACPPTPPPGPLSLSRFLSHTHTQSLSLTHTQSLSRALTLSLSVCCHSSGQGVYPPNGGTLKAGAGATAPTPLNNSLLHLCHSFLQSTHSGLIRRTRCKISPPTAPRLR